MTDWVYAGEASRCPWKIHWGTGQESTTQCDRPEHDVTADPDHEGPTGVMDGQRVTWVAGDRREYTGEWPGLCPDQPCILHAGHRGRHAP
jgi:hypothetical protein